MVTIGSQILLPELEFFRAQWVADDDVDIAVRVGDVGGRGPRRRARDDRVRQPDDHAATRSTWAGSAPTSASSSATASTSTVGPLLARSPHVVYTNILEALLRFVHGLPRPDAAALGLRRPRRGRRHALGADRHRQDRHVLRLLREHGGRFLSDDMTVIDADGNAVCFPKPLTISAHTLRAVHADDLTPREWRRLQIQSRLHSKGGRSLALALARFNLPIMGINALTQMLVPPPKYTVDRLVPCRIGQRHPGRGAVHHRAGRTRLARPRPRRRRCERMIDEHRRRLRLPAVPVPRAGHQHRRPRLPRAARSASGRSCAASCRTSAPGCSPRTRFGWADEIPRLLVAPQTPGSGAAPAVPAPTADGTARGRRGVAPLGWTRPGPAGDPGLERAYTARMAVVGGHGCHPPGTERGRARGRGHRPYIGRQAMMTDATAVGAAADVAEPCAALPIEAPAATTDDAGTVTPRSMPRGHRRARHLFG